MNFDLYKEQANSGFFFLWKEKCEGVLVMDGELLREGRFLKMYLWIKQV